MDGLVLVFSGYPPNCPLPEAVPAEGGAFRITANDPPTGEDFRSLHELGMQPKFKPSAARECKCRSLSIYRTIEDARHHLKIFSSHGRYIAAGSLCQESGKTLLTPSPPDRKTHTEWWCADGYERHRGFLVIEEATDVDD